MSILKTALPVLLALFLTAPTPLSTDGAPPLTAVKYVDALPESWSPLAESTPAGDFLLERTREPLYRMDDQGGTKPVLAAIPEDVTALYAGDALFGVPYGAERGYAFQINLLPEACWQDGSPITAQTLAQTLELLLTGEKLEQFPAIANWESYCAGKIPANGQVISLQEAGFSTVEEAGQAGYTAFYVNTDHFWGLDKGWLPITDGTRLFDAAVQPGIFEQYITAAYLYRQYLATGREYDYLQSEFVGISGNPEDKFTFQQVGIQVTGDRQITLILENPTVPTALMLALSEVHLINPDLAGADYCTSAETGDSCGAYIVTAVTDREIVLDLNPAFPGETPKIGRVICRLGE